MKYVIAILVVFVLTILGCGGLGGQGFSVKIVAENGSTIEKVEINLNADDGGTDMGGLFYRPNVKGDAKVGVATTQPSE